MEKHAIPHNFMEVEFKLFGNLTVKQFGYLAISSLIALVLYFSGIPRLISVPLVIITVVLGLALTFLTVDGMPFSRWFGNFISSVISPQRKVYRKQADTPSYLEDTRTTTATKKDGSAKINNLPTQKRTNYLKAMQALESDAPAARNGATPVPPVSAANQVAGSQDLDVISDQRLASLNKYFNDRVDQDLGKYNRPLNTATEVPASGITTKAPGNVSTQTNSRTSTSPTVNSVPAPAEPTTAPKTEPEAAPKTEPAPAPIQTPTPPTTPQPTIQSAVSTVQQPTKPEMPEPQLADTGQNSAAFTSGSAASNDGINVIRQIQPNQITGFAVDKKDQPIAKAKITIKDEAGKPVRTVFSNSIGKFISPTQLPSGNYKIEITASGYKFPEYELELKNEILPMYRYQAK